MGYNQHQMWNSYGNYGGGGTGSGGYMDGAGYMPPHAMTGPNSPGMAMEWWQQQQQQAAAGGNPRLPGDPNFRPGGPGGPGWAMRGGLSPGGGIRGPRPDRRGPGRPRLSSAKLPPGMPGDISGPPIPGAPGRMSPGINRFPPPFGAPPSAIVMPGLATNSIFFCFLH